MSKSKEVKRLEANFRLAKGKLLQAINAQKNHFSFLEKEYPNADYSEKHFQDTILCHENEIEKAINEYVKFPLEMQTQGLEELILDEKYKNLVLSKIII